MAVKYTKKTINRAAELCSMQACARFAGDMTDDVIDSFKDDPGYALALDAFMETPWAAYDGHTGAEWAEAESWLRSGWTPENNHSPWV